jgi:hypothetical protein
MANTPQSEPAKTYAVRQFERPDWNKWKLVLKCELWKAVCLSLDVDPRQDYFALGVKLTKSFPNAPQELSDRLEVLLGNLSMNGPVCPQPPHSPGVLQDPFAPVLLSEVASFAAQCGWPIPMELRDLIPRPQSERGMFEPPTEAATAAAASLSQGSSGTAVKWTPERLAELAAFREKQGTKKAAAQFGISEQRVRALLPKKKPSPPVNSVFNRS